MISDSLTGWRTAYSQYLWAFHPDTPASHKAPEDHNLHQIPTSSHASMRMPITLF